VFKLKLPNGLEVEYRGDKDYVTSGYGDIKSAAAELFNREAGRTSREQAMDKLLGAMPTPPAIPADAAQSAPALPVGESRKTVESQKAASSARPKKRFGQTKKADGAKSHLFQEREAKVDQFIQATSFEDFERFNGALNKDGASLSDLAALITRLAQTQFGFEEGMAPNEVHKVLQKRFFINPSKRSLEKAMSREPGTFFAVGPADFDGRARLYRPMKDCIVHVDALLGEFDNARIAEVDGTENQVAEDGTAVN
jgi:hypothetical protein